MKKYYIIAFIAYIISCAMSYAAEEKTYQQAYDICSPAVHQLVQQECHYGVVFEKYYQACMEEGGFSDEMELDPAFYTRYLKYHKRCSATAQHTTEEKCHYGGRYKKHYSRCMQHYGFDDTGEYNPSLTIEPSNEETGEDGEEGTYFEYNF